jgi:OOP family OmpA-OmpF porin
MSYLDLDIIRKWWPGLVPLLLLVVVTAWFCTGPVERALTERGNAALKNLVLSKPKIELLGRDATVTGQIFSDEGRLAAVTALGNIGGVRLVHDHMQLVPEIKPFSWTARRDNVRITLDGAVPLPAARVGLVAAARTAASGAEVIDQMEFGRGAPARFEAAAQLLLRQFAGLKSGEVKISDTGVSIAGTARALGDREAIVSALKELPEGFTLTSSAITAPPYIFQAIKDPVAATLTLSGNIPDDNMRRTLVAVIGRKFFGEKIVDNLKISIGAPPNFIAAVTASLGRLSRLSTGSLSVSDRDIRLSGDALYEAAATQVQSVAAGDLPQGWKMETEVSIKPSAGSVDSSVCQQLFSDVLAKTTIRFESGRAAIDGDSIGLLDHLVATAQRCPSANIVIAGHTDSDGDDQTNLALSERRAMAVVDFLVKGGVQAERLKPVGYGRAQPIASNDTEEGKAQNRRIEFKVE